MTIPLARERLVDNPLTVQIAHTLPACRTLGPGRRGVVWVQGCARRCEGCVAGPILGEGGQEVPVDRLVERILGWPDIEGVTWSGGEPFEQAEAVFAVCRRLRQARDLSLMAYTGHTLGELLASPDPWTRRLVGVLDILVDGPFVMAEMEDRLWRGSSNQRIHLLTSRHADITATRQDISAGVELHLRRDGTVFWAGVPELGFEARLRRELRSAGVDLIRSTGVWS